MAALGVVLKRAIATLLLALFFVAVLNATRAMASPLSGPSDRCAANTRVFSDVAKGDYFCPAIASMISAGAISGYDDNTFRPYNTVTRSQFAKMLVIRFGWTLLDPPTPSFADVARTDPFYKYIETGYARFTPGGERILNGYNTIPPCATGQTRCFKPQNNVTRGQMIKMIVNAAGYTDDVSARSQTFVDVDRNNAFFPQIERAAMRNLIAQWPPNAPARPYCSSYAQPCFFWNSDALRGDAAIHISMGFHGPAYEQVSAQISGTTPGLGDFTGAAAYLSVPDATLSAGDWSISVVSVTSRWGYYVSESGIRKQCYFGGSCEWHPFAKWSDEYQQRQHWMVEFPIPEPSQPNWYFSTVYANEPGAQWRQYFCDTSGNCFDYSRHIPVNGDIGAAQNFVTVGGETIRYGTRFGYVAVGGFRYRAPTTWSLPVCYQTQLVPWLSRNGQLSTCYDGSFSLRD